MTSPGFARLLSILPAKKIIVHERGSAWNCSSARSQSVSMVAEKASLIRSEMKEKTPPCFQRGIYEKSTIIKILKNKSWGDN